MSRYRHFWAWSAVALAIGTIGVSALRPTFAAAFDAANEPTLLAQTSQRPEGKEGKGSRQGRRQPPDFAAAAAQLGVSEDALLDALHPEGRPQRGEG